MRLDLVHVLETWIHKRGMILLALKSVGGLDDDDDALHAARITIFQGPARYSREGSEGEETLIWRDLRHDRCRLLVALEVNRRRIRRSLRSRRSREPVECLADIAGGCKIPRSDDTGGLCCSLALLDFLEVSCLL